MVSLRRDGNIVDRCLLLTISFSHAQRQLGELVKNNQERTKTFRSKKIQHQRAGG